MIDDSAVHVFTSELTSHKALHCVMAACMLCCGRACSQLRAGRPHLASWHCNQALLLLESSLSDCCWDSMLLIAVLLSSSGVHDDK
jgi:hypothetical protein